MANNTLYDVLRIATDCPPENIRAAYERNLEVFENIHRGDEVKLKAGRNILGNAYLTLSDPGKRSEYDKENKIKKRFKKNKTHKIKTKNNFLLTMLTAMTSAIWSLIRPVAKIAIFIGCVWMIFFSEYTADIRNDLLNKGKIFIAGILPEPVDPYETLQCKKLRTKMADMVRQEKHISESLKTTGLFGLGATALSLFAGKKEVAGAAYRATLTQGVPQSRKLKALRIEMKQIAINHLECFKPGIGKGQKLGPVISSKKQENLNKPPVQVIVRPIINNEVSTKLPLNYKNKWERNPPFGSREWDKKYPTPYSK